jgi:valyl-tRNA synthetase
MIKNALSQPRPCPGFYDITYLVIRMIFQGLEYTGKSPFKNAHPGMIRYAQGRKMSKTLGNGIDPHDTSISTASTPYAISLRAHSSRSRKPATS